MQRCMYTIRMSSAPPPLTPTPRPRGPIRRALRTVASVLLLPFIAFEEWGWRPIARLMVQLAQWRPIARLETKITSVSRATALVLFVLPSLLLIPVKFAALWLISNHHQASGVAVIIVAKIFSTALLGRLFTLTKAQLLTFAQFARVYHFWRETKTKAKAWIKATGVWQATLRVGRQLRRLFR